MNARRKLLTALSLAGVVHPLASLAQQPGKVWRVGILSVRTPVPTLATDPTYSHFVKGLVEAGYIEGKNVIYELRSADGKYEKLPTLADELIKANVDVILAATPPCIQAAKRATNTIPIVMVAVGDPVALGFVASYARPGGNITGVSNAVDDISSKYLELLRTAIPKLQRVASLVNPDNPNTQKILSSVQASAKVMGMEVVTVQARTADQIGEALAAARQGRAQAVIVQADGFFAVQGRLISEIALKNRLPTMWWLSAPVQAGGLMGYGSELSDDYRKAALFVGRILKGAKPVDLPVEQPTILKFTLNRKTADALGLRIPQELLLRANEVIE